MRRPNLDFAFKDCVQHQTPCPRTWQDVQVSWLGSSHDSRVYLYSDLDSAKYKELLLPEGSTFCLLRHGWILRCSWSTDWAFGFLVSKRLLPLIIFCTQTLFCSRVCFRVCFHVFVRQTYTSLVFCQERTVTQTVDFQCLSRSSLISESHRNLRRRHGIPDADRRPFVAAYPDVQKSSGSEDSGGREAERARKEAEMTQKLTERLETYKFNFGALVLNFWYLDFNSSPDAPNCARKPVEKLPRIPKEEKELLIQDAKLLKRFAYPS